MKKQAIFAVLMAGILCAGVVSSLGIVEYGNEESYTNENRLLDFDYWSSPYEFWAPGEQAPSMAGVDMVEVQRDDGPDALLMAFKYGGHGSLEYCYILSDDNLDVLPMLYSTENNTKILRMESGDVSHGMLISLAAKNGYVFAAYETGSSSAMGISFQYAEDTGRGELEWSDPMVVVAQGAHQGMNQHPGIIVDDDNTIIITWASYVSGSIGTGELFMATSRDGGGSWQHQQMTDDAHKNLQPTPLRMSNGDLILSWHSDRAADMDQIYVRTTSETGAQLHQHAVDGTSINWNQADPIQVTSGSGRGFEPDVLEIDGTIWIAYDDWDYRCWLAKSDDFGATWTTGIDDGSGTGIGRGNTLHGSKRYPSITYHQSATPHPDGGILIKESLWYLYSFDHTSQIMGVGIQEAVISEEVVPDGDPPEITLIAPNGGEIYDAGDLVDIEWSTVETDDPIDRIDLWYSTNDGASWTSIASGIPDSSPYSWEIPNLNSDECRVRVRVYDTAGRNDQDISDGTFQIIGTAPAAPTNLQVEHYGMDETLVVFGENFSGVPDGAIPSGWTRSHTHWGAVNTNEAGGVAPELRYLGSGTSTTTFRCYTPAIDTTGYTELDYSFRHRYVHLIGSITLRAEISTDGSSWSTLWQHTGGSTGPAVVDMTLDTTDGVGSSTLYLAWSFTGRSNDARRWLIDDISLSTEVESEGDEDNLITWDKSADDPSEVSTYRIYRSENYNGPWDTQIASVSATGTASYSYRDRNKGAADETLWWYLVRAVGTNGMVEQNTNSVREPGPTETFDIPLTVDATADGWNFVSFNLIPESTSLEAILSDIGGSYDRVMYYDASTGRWSSYMPGRAARYNNLNSWNHHMGLWIQMTSAVTLTVEGSLPTTTDISLHPGWNMVGLPSETSGNHGLPAEVDVVGYFDASASGNLAYSYSPGTFVFEPGEAYWVHNPTSSILSWEVSY